MFTWMLPSPRGRSSRSAVYGGEIGGGRANMFGEGGPSRDGRCPRELERPPRAEKVRGDRAAPQLPEIVHSIPSQGARRTSRSAVARHAPRPVRPFAGGGSVRSHAPPRTRRALPVPPEAPPGVTAWDAVDRVFRVLISIAEGVTLEATTAFTAPDGASRSSGGRDASRVGNDRSGCGRQGGATCARVTIPNVPSDPTKASA